MSDFDEPQNPFEDEKPKNLFASDDPQSTFADEEPRSSALVIHERTWKEIWQMAITKPSLETYTDILRDRNITVGRGATWVFIAYIVSYVGSAFSQIIFGSLYAFGSDSGSGGISAGIGVIGLICSPIIAGFAVGIWLLFMGINHLIARYLLGGKGDYDQLVFALASYVAPITIISGLANFVPFVGLCVSGALGLYSLYLAVVAMNAAHQFGWVKSIIATYAIPVLFACCICGLIIVLVGSAEGGFQDIIDSLVSPTPFGR